MNRNPYAADLEDLDPFKALGETPFQIQALVDSWREEDFERSYAPGKWSGRKILVHLAQTELGLSTRVRYALATQNYQAQSFDQDQWMPLDERMDARTALEAYTTLRRMNLSMWHGLSEAQLSRSFTHPEYGQLDVGWVAAQMAGHDIHHLKHFQQIATTV